MANLLQTCIGTMACSPIVCATTCVVSSNRMLIVHGTGGNTAGLVLRPTDNANEATYFCKCGYHSVIGAHPNEGFVICDGSSDVFKVWGCNNATTAMRCSASAPIFCGTGCVQSPIVCGTSCVSSDKMAVTCLTGQLQSLEFTDGSLTANAGTQTNYNIYRSCGAWTNPFPDLVINYHTGIRFGAYFGYQGFRFFCNTPESTAACGTCSAGLLFSIGKGDPHTRVHCGNFYSCNLVQSPIVCATTRVYSPMVCGACVYVTGVLRRTGHHTGHLEGTYNNIGDNSYKSNPIYTIGSSYNPTDAAMSNMYGIGYSHTNASFITGALSHGGWGMYVAAAGVARIWLEGNSGIGAACSCWIAPVVCATSYFVTNGMKICGEGANRRMKFSGSGDNSMLIGSYDDNAWGYIESTNNANGIYFGTNQGNFQFDTGSLGSYTDAEVDVGYSGKRFRCSWVSGVARADNCVYSPIVCGTSCVEAAILRVNSCVLLAGGGSRIWVNNRRQLEGTTDGAVTQLSEDFTCLRLYGLVYACTCIQSPYICATNCVKATTLCATGDVKIGETLRFTTNTPYICTGGAYIVVPSGIYVSGGTLYAQSISQHRGGICNDSGAHLTFHGGNDAGKCSMFCGKTFSGCCIQSPIVCATTGFYGSGANLTGISAGYDTICSTTCHHGGTECYNVILGLGAFVCTKANACCVAWSVGVGAYAGQRTCGANNTFIGVSAGAGYGSDACDRRMDGNTMVGVAAGSNGVCKNATCDFGNNVFLGYGSGGGQPHWGSENTVLGTTAGDNLQGAACGNTYIGYYAGYNCTTACNQLVMGSYKTQASAGGSASICYGCIKLCGAVYKASGSFLITHPNPEKRDTTDLFHSFVESPTAGDNIYRWQVDVQNCRNVITLPDYYRFLNENDMVWISPYKNFGSAYGEVTEDQKCLIVCSNQDGKYNVLLIGTRKDECATYSWNGAERGISDLSPDMEDVFEWGAEDENGNRNILSQERHRGPAGPNYTDW